MSGAYSQDPSVMRKSIIPLVTNAYDLGSTSKYIRTAYLQTSIIFTGNPFLIAADTSGGADTKAITISGAGAFDNTRLAGLGLYGNQSATTPGIVSLFSSTLSGAYITLSAPASNGVINLATNGATRWTVDQNGLLTGAAGSGISLASGKGYLALNGKTLDADITGTFAATPDFTCVNGLRLLCQSSADANSVAEYWLKTRATDTSGNTIVASGDNVINIGAWAADGTVYRNIANIIARVVGTPGLNDIPSEIEFRTRSQGGSNNRSVAIASDKSINIVNCTSVPGTIAGSGSLYVESGALKYKGSSGTITTIANA